jgi:putative endonuclease
MPLDSSPRDKRALAGRTAYEGGLAAEDSVLRDYQLRGYKLLQMRWRGRCGEIDLIFEHGDTYVFVEVKKAATHDIAAERLSDRQLWRIARSAEDYIATHAPDPFTPMRLDLAMVDGQGRLAILQNLMLS